MALSQEFIKAAGYSGSQDPSGDQSGVPSGITPEQLNMALFRTMNGASPVLPETASKGGSASDEKIKTALRGVLPDNFSGMEPIDGITDGGGIR